MARTRYIKPDFTQDIDTATVSIAARYLYENLWCHMDRDGVCLADPRVIKKDVFPYDDDLTAKKVKVLLDELVCEGFLYPLSYEGKDYYVCPTLAKHQNFHKEELSKYRIPEETRASAVQVQCNYGSTTEVAPNNLRNEVKSYSKKLELRVLSKKLEKNEFEKIYEKYPRKVGKQKGIERCQAQIKSPEELALLSAAVDRYRDHCAKEGKEPQYVQHFSTFMTCWRDWLEPDTGTSSLGAKKSTLDILREMDNPA